METYRKKHIQKWYFVTKIVLTYCEKKIVLVIEEKKKGLEFAKFLRSLEQLEFKFGLRNMKKNGILLPKLF